MTRAPLPTRRRLLRSILGLVCLVCLVAAAWTTSVGLAVLRGLHPATAVLLVIVTLLGLGLLTSGVPGLPGARGGRRSGLRRRLGGAGRSLLAVLVVGLAGATAWLRPSGATSERIAEVVIVKQPLQIAFLSTGAAVSVIAHHPEVTTWAVGGHSLGGVVAAGETEDQGVSGLLLWAAYPASSIADEAGIAVTSVTGSADALTTPAKVAETSSLLPAGTRYVEVDGAVHADFGDYGPQDGDGEPTTSRSSAQEQIVAASQALLSGLGG